MRLTVFTAWIGMYDVPRPAPEFRRCGAVPGCRHRCVAITDSEQTAPGWEIRRLEPSPDPKTTARMIKILSHRWFPDADTTIWLDGAMSMNAPPTALLDWIAREDMAAFAHPSRDCAYAEGERCVVKGKAGRQVISRQLSAYRDQGFPEHFGLVETGVLVRRHTDAVKELNEAWWEQILRYSRRDQVSLPYVSWQKGLQIYRSIGSLIHHPWFTHHGHRGK